MARRAACQLDRAPNISFFLQFLADFCLIRRGFPAHVVNLIERPQRHLGVAMAVQTPLHQQRICLEHQRHLVHAAVARRAAYALIYVNAVIEINVIRQPVHLHTLNRSICPLTFANWFQVTDVIKEGRMAAHAGFCWRDSSGRGRFN